MSSIDCGERWKDFNSFVWKWMFVTWTWDYKAMKQDSKWKDNALTPTNIQGE